MIRRARERGMTLVVALVMLAVLTLLVASAIRFGNINLKITGNAQSETEASAAASVGLESMVKTISTASNISSLTGQSVAVTTGGMTYTVTITTPACLFNKPVNNTDLDSSKTADRMCFNTNDGERQQAAGGNLSTVATACRDQQWDVAATVNDSKTGAKTSLLQGISVRVGAEVACP